MTNPSIGSSKVVTATYDKCHLHPLHYHSSYLTCYKTEDLQAAKALQCIDLRVKLFKTTCNAQSSLGENHLWVHTESHATLQGFATDLEHNSSGDQQLRQQCRQASSVASQKLYVSTDLYCGFAGNKVGASSGSSWACLSAVKAVA